MKILAIGVDAATVAFLRGASIAVELQDTVEADELGGWITDTACDVAVIDLDSSGLGVYVTRSLRVQQIATPVIGITKDQEGAKWSERRAMFLENGGDDLLRQPVNPRELIASSSAISRRQKGSLVDVLEYDIEGARVRINLVTRLVHVNGELLHMTAKEHAIVSYFASAPGRVLSKEMIMSRLYGMNPDEEPEIKIVDVFVCKARKKLSQVIPGLGEKFIETIWGRGYRLPEGYALKQHANMVQAAAS